jgi:hypothetical protein
MHWYTRVLDFVVGCLLVGLLFGLPIGVIAGWTWWVRVGRQIRGWRGVTSKLGVLYSSVILGVIAVCEFRIPHAPAGAEFPYAYHWAPIVFRVSIVGVVIALLGKGWARAASLVTALGGCVFAVMLLAWL